MSNGEINLDGVRNIIFDMGGVLLALNGQRCRKAFERLGAQKTAVYVREMRTEDLFLDIETGRITTEEFCGKVRQLDGITASDAEICDAWNMLLEPTPDETRAALTRLKQTHRLFLLSNTNDIHWQYASKKLIPYPDGDIGELFERTFVSYEMGIRKPAPEIFRRVTDELGLRPEETLFIDDNPTNTASAASIGLKVFHESPEHSFWEMVAAHPRPACAAIGFFDGVHKGHRYMIRRLRNEAARHGLRSMIITFRQHPRQVLQQDYIPKLLTSARRKELLLRETGVDEVVMLDFTTELSRHTAREFMQLMRDRLGVRRLLIGYDHHFGHNREEGFAEYVAHGKELGIEVVANDAFSENGVNVSSSVVRRLISDGKIAEANDCLGYPFGLAGVVIRGRGEGRKIGYPTANMLTAPDQMIPRRGVYAVRVKVEGFAEEFVGMMNIGCRPTYGGGDESLEVNIFDFDADIYDHYMAVSFVSRLRDERRFGSVEELKAQLARDKAAIYSLHLRQTPYDRR